MTTTTGSTRAEHLQWCKDRALEYVDRGGLMNAFVSMISDLGKHEETCNHPAIRLGTDLYLAGHLSGADKMRKFIEGFN